VPSRVKVNETQIKIYSERKWLYAANATESKLLLEVNVHGRRGICSAAAILDRLTEKHDLSESEFLVNEGGDLIALARYELSGHLDYNNRNHIETQFQRVTMRIDRFHLYWRGSQSSARRWLRRFRYY